MAYLRPPWFVRSVFNNIAMRTGVGGTATLEISGRHTSQLQHVPVVPVDIDGITYLVSTRGESEWVRNLRAAQGRGALHRRGQAPLQFEAKELTVEERPPVIEAYRAEAGKTVKTYFEKLPDPADHPTFRLTAKG